MASKICESVKEGVLFNCTKRILKRKFGRKFLKWNKSTLRTQSELSWLKTLILLIGLDQIKILLINWKFCWNLSGRFCRVRWFIWRLVRCRMMTWLWMRNDFSISFEWFDSTCKFRKNQISFRFVLTRNNGSFWFNFHLDNNSTWNQL